MRTQVKTAEYYLGLHYPVTLKQLRPEDGGGYAASIPLLGSRTFVAVGETPGDAYAALDELKEQLIPMLVDEGTVLPEPEEEGDEREQFSGKILLRVTPQLHRSLAHEARRGGCSINHLATELLVNGLTAINAAYEAKSMIAQVIHDLLDDARQKRSFKQTQSSTPIRSGNIALQWPETEIDTAEDEFLQAA